MAKITLFGDAMLAIKQPVKNESGLELPGDGDPWGAIYDIKMAGPEAPVKRGDAVILKPGSYEHLKIHGQNYLFLTADDLAGKVE